MIALALTFAVRSATFAAGTAMPLRSVYNRSGCHGGNRSPELHWSNAPHGTRSFAIVMHDPDAPVRGGWYHWVVYNLSARTHELAEGARLPAYELGTTSWGARGYGGPCPPPGKPHHYVITIYALDIAHLAQSALTGPQLLHIIEHHTLAKAAITGTHGE